MAGELHGQVSCKPVGTFDKHHPNAIAGDLFEHGGKAWARGHHIGATYRLVVKPGHHDVASALGISLDGGALPPLTVLAVANIGGRRGPHVGDGLNPFPIAGH